MGFWRNVILCSALWGLAFQAGYRIGKQDIIRIEVAGETELSQELTVSEKGTVSYAMLGELAVERLTATELSELIRKLLIEKKILTQPGVSIAIKEYRSQAATILGEVRTPGKFFMKGSEILLDVIVQAGGLTAGAGEITISRTEAGGHRVLTVNADDLLRDRTPIESGDVIFVRAKPIAQVFVSGDVVAGKPLVFAEGMTVSQAIVMAGGLTRFGSKSKISIRRTEGGQDVILRVNLSDIEKGKAKDIGLLPNDHVFVGRRIF
jgi:polysaccharide export outer membrane protein